MDRTPLDYRDLYELAPVMMMSVEPLSGKILCCNRQVPRRLGYSPDRIGSMSIFDLCDSVQQQLMRRTMQRLVDGEDRADESLVIRCCDGAAIDAWLRAAAVRSDTGQIRFANCVWQDISQRKRAESELGESRRQLQAILNHAPAVIYVKDLDGRYLLINRRFEELAELTMDEMRGKTDAELFSAAAANELRMHDVEVLRRNGPTVFEETVDQGTEPRTYLTVKFPLQDETGSTYAVGGISTDITARIKAEAQLHESEQRFRQLADNIQDCFWVVEVSTWNFLYVSAAYETIWGRSRDELYADSGRWLKAVHPADRMRVRRALARHLTLGQYDEEYRLERPDGTIRWVHDRGVPVRNPAGEVFRLVGIAQDITERKQLQKQVSDISAREQSRISQEIHDELGQQLTGLSFLAKSLERKLGDHAIPAAADATTLADGIQETIREVRRLVRGLAPVDLDEHGLRIALEQLAQTTTTRSNITCQFSDAFEVSIPDNIVATQLYRIAQEAVNNAVKYSQARHIDVSLDGHGGTILLRIRDDGVGLPADQLAEGGMGLQIMNYRAGMIGANLEVTSSRDSGTEILCILRGETDGNHANRDG